MKKIISLTLSILMILLLLCSCSGSENFSDDDNMAGKYTRNTDTQVTYNYSDGVTEAPAEYSVFLNQITDFELRMFRNYNNSTKNESYVFCPVSTALQLGLMANGASGDTRNEIIKALGINLSLDSINQCSSYFKSRIEAVAAEQGEKTDSLSGKKVSDTTNGLVQLDSYFLFNDTADIKTKFLQSDADYYASNIYRFLFSDSSMLTKVNNLFTSYGDDKKFSSLDSKNNLISVTNSDICDIWLDAYAKTEIEKGSFSSSEGSRDVTYMTSNETYMHTDKAQAIMKYTSKTPLKFMAILPNEDITLDEYISDFTNLEFSNLLDSVDFKTKATAKIPEFSIDTQKNAFCLTSIIEDSGLYSTFTDQATFSELTYTDDFRFNEMYEITPKISVNACGIGGTQSNGNKPALDSRTSELAKNDIMVEFNRPFIFLILDNESNIPVYIGTVDAE